MNERIKQLWSDAAESNGGDSWEEQTAFMSKFAELIVRECVAICQDIDGEEDAMAKCGRQDCAVEIKEHFGVEE
jgi:hypothetical protein